jgi:hypothetical protein
MGDGGANSTFGFAVAWGGGQGGEYAARVKARANVRNTNGVATKGAGRECADCYLR